MISRSHIPTLLILAGLFVSGCGTLSPDEVANYNEVKMFNLGPEVNSKFDDYGFDMHRNRLLYTSNRPTVEGYIQGDDIWFSDKESAGWSKALNIGGAINTEYDEGAPYITADGTEVFFVQCWTPDGLGDCDIYVANFNYRGQWQSLRNLGDAVNTKYWDSHPYLSPEGDELYFSSSRPGGQGKTDLYVSKRLRSGAWGPAKNLGSLINTSGNEKSPTIAPNGDLFFSSDTHKGLGGYDLFRSKNLGRKGWSNPENIGLPFNTEVNDIFFRLSEEEDTVFVSSNRKGGIGGYDVWGFTPNPFKDTSRYIFKLAGMVFDSTTEMGISNAKLIVKRKSEEPFSPELRNGRFSVRVQRGEQLILTGSADGYESRTVTVDIPIVMNYNEYRKNVGLPAKKSPVTATTTEKDGDGDDEFLVLFEFDKWTLTSEGTGKLDLLFEKGIRRLIEAKAEFEIILDAHTDDYGTEAYNIRLSRLRGASVSKYLQSKGVPISVIVTNAYGENKPVDTNATDAGRLKNRRVEIQIKATEP